MALGLSGEDVNYLILSLARYGRSMSSEFEECFLEVVVEHHVDRLYDALSTLDDAKKIDDLYSDLIKEVRFRADEIDRDELKQNTMHVLYGDGLRHPKENEKVFRLVTEFFSNAIDDGYEDEDNQKLKMGRDII